MLTLLRDSYAAMRTRARYRRRISERLLELAEEHGNGPQSVAADEPGWRPLGLPTGVVPSHASIRDEVRHLIATNPHAKNLLRLLEIYVVGPEFGLRHVIRSGSDGEPDPELITRADDLWSRFLTDNGRHYSVREHYRRAYRDGEAFVRLFDSPVWPPPVRFVDPERIAEPVGSSEPESRGIRCDPEDAETPLDYLLIDPRTGRLSETVPAAEMLHTRREADSNQRRGTSPLACVLPCLRRYDAWRETELTARKLQASIVLWRRVQGGGPPANFSGEPNGAPGLPSGPGIPAETGRERYAPGTILTTSGGTHLEFLQPNTNFGDAVPLGRMLLLSIAAGAGLPEFMLTSDASNANFASTMVAEGPAVKLFESEQHDFTHEVRELWRRVMTRAVRQGLLPDRVFSRIEPVFTFPSLVNRDRTAERLSNARLVEADILSRAEAARRDGADPDRMREEIMEERGSSIVDHGS